MGAIIEDGYEYINDILLYLLFFKTTILHKYMLSHDFLVQSLFLMGHPQPKMCPFICIIYLFIYF